jgi:hypothetical protein
MLHDPDLDPLRAQPRYERFLEALNAKIAERAQPTA